MDMELFKRLYCIVYFGCFKLFLVFWFFLLEIIIVWSFFWKKYNKINDLILFESSKFVFIYFENIIKSLKKNMIIMSVLYLYFLWLFVFVMLFWVMFVVWVWYVFDDYIIVMIYFFGYYIYWCLYIVLFLMYFILFLRNLF